ncbi:MAG TPA: TonB-dependent receptor [Bryobacteraceae bacterium]|jgi:hypothetical protein|nr:TonB-dependent receptor [Bryobacteraceae bacterium]
MYFVRLLLCVLAAVAVAFAQTSEGEVRFSVHDVTGNALAASVDLNSESNSTHKTVRANEDGEAVVRHLPYGIYHYMISLNGFKPASGMVEIRSGIPVKLPISLIVGPVKTVVDVEDHLTLLDPHQLGSAVALGSRQLTEQNRSTPGRALPELLAMQPGWLLEANGVLHPRGSEYQVQYIVDGLPLTDNRSPSFAPPFDIDNIQSLQVLTGSYPAEFGRKLGGVIEVTTTPDLAKGLHGKAVLGGGSFNTEHGSFGTQYGWGRNFAGISAEGARTDRYLDPPVLNNYTNSATTASFSGQFERDLTDDQRLGFTYSHSDARFQVPNELLQQMAGQRQDRDSGDNELQGRYQRVLSPVLLFTARGLFEDVNADLWSNELSDPIAAFQSRGFKQGYIASGVAGQAGANNWKAGGDFLYGAVHEAFAYNVTNPDYFDPDTPRQFSFHGHALDREGSLYAQDVYRYRNLSLSGGLRWDGYNLLVKEQAWSPRLGASFYWPAAKMLFHASYDRVFQTPAIENLLLASTPEVSSLSDQVLRLPVKPSHGNFYDAGISEALAAHVRLDVDVFRRYEDNFADDDVFLNTGVSFPIAFSHAQIHGVEARLSIPKWGPLSAFLSYSNQTGTGFLPVTGGLLLGDDASTEISQTSSFPISQDQRNTAAAQVRYQVSKRVWIASSGVYGSGLPTEIASGDIDELISQYSQAVVNRVNFDRNRVRPSFTVNFSGGAAVWKHESRSVDLQADFLNVTDRLNVIDFAGLFSGTALAPPRSASARLTFSF